MRGTISDYISRIGRRVNAYPVRAVAAASLAVAILADGVGRSPAFERYLIMAQNPGSDPGITGTGSFVLGSPSGSLLAALVGADTEWSFALFHFTLVVASFAVTVWATKRRFGDGAARAVALLWTALPLSTVLLTWLGQPDPLLFSAGTALALVSNPVFVVPWAAFGGFTNWPQMLVAVGAVAVIRRSGWKWIAGALLGVLIGALGVVVWHQAAGITQETDRINYFFEVGPLVIAGKAATVWQPLLWSLFAGVWLLVLMRMNKRVALVIAALATVAVFTLDSTRVFALISWPLVFLLVAKDANDLTAGWLAVSAVFVPPVVVWSGRVLGPEWFDLLKPALG